MLNTLIHHCEAVLHLRFSDGIMVTCSKVSIQTHAVCLLRSGVGLISNSTTFTDKNVLVEYFFTMMYFPTLKVKNNAITAYINAQVT